jgi:hypothetical protein
MDTLSYPKQTKARKEHRCEKDFDWGILRKVNLRL